MAKRKTNSSQTKEKKKKDKNHPWTGRETPGKNN